MARMLLFTLVSVFSFTHALTNLPFSWNTVPTFAFPGMHDGFFGEETIDKYNFTTFQQLLSCGMNVSCIADNGTIFPASTSTSNHYFCPNNQFYPNMEVSLQHQADLFKEYADKKKKAPTSHIAVRKSISLVQIIRMWIFFFISPNVTVIAYIIFVNAQNSYLNQYMFNSAYNSEWWLHLDGIGTIDCYDGSYGCQWQGPSQYENFT